MPLAMIAGMVAGTGLSGWLFSSQWLKRPLRDHPVRRQTYSALLSRNFKRIASDRIIEG
jgi:hypothetical protein